MSGGRRGGGRGNARQHQPRDPALGPTPVNPPRLYQCVRNVTLPAGVDQWARSEDGKRTIVNAAIGVGDVSFFAGMIKLHGDYLDEVDRAALLVEAVLDHRLRLQQRLAVKDKLDEERARVQGEIDAGLRCEFKVQPHLMGLVVGIKGARIRQTQQECRIDRVVVDRDQSVVRIVGADPAEVRKARGMLELRQEVVSVPDDKTRRVIIGKGGATIKDVQRRSGAISIDVDHERGEVKVLGTASAAAAAKVLVESFVQNILDMDAATDELEELRKDVNRLDVAWGEETNYYTVQGGHGQREGFHGHDGAHYRGGYDRGGGRGGGRGPGGGSPFGGGGGRGGRGGRGAPGYRSSGGASHRDREQAPSARPEAKPTRGYDAKPKPAPAPAPAPSKKKEKENKPKRQQQSSSREAPTSNKTAPAADGDAGVKAKKPKSKKPKAEREEKPAAATTKPKPVPAPAAAAAAAAPEGAKEQRPPRKPRRPRGGGGGEGGPVNAAAA